MLCLFVAGTCFTRTFLQLRSPPPSCQPRETDDVLYGNKEKLFSTCPAPYSQKSVTGPLQTTPYSRARRAVVAWGIVKRLIEPCITELHFSSIRSPFPWLVQAVFPPFSYDFRFLLQFSALRKFTPTGACYGLLTTSNPVGGIMFV